HGVRTVAVEPKNCRALGAALEAGEPVDVTVDSVAADSLGARRATPLAVAAAQSDLVTSVLVDDEAIIAARTRLWDEHRLAVEHAAATALAGVSGAGDSKTEVEGNVDGATDGYVPAVGEEVCVVQWGANTDLSDIWSCRSARSVAVLRLQRCLDEAEDGQRHDDGDDGLDEEPRNGERDVDHPPRDDDGDDRADDAPHGTHLHTSSLGL